MNTLPKSLNRWTILLGIIILSLLLTYFVTNKGNSDNTTSQKPLPTVAEINKQNTDVKSNLNSDPVKVNLEYNLVAGYIDIYITNPNLVENGELLFALSDTTKFSKIEENTLFEKYLTSSEVDKVTGKRVLRVGVTKGIEGESLKPGVSQKFARLYFSNLKENTVQVEEANSVFMVGSGKPKYPEYKVMVEK